MQSAKKAVTSQNKGQSEDSTTTTVKKTTKKTAKKIDVEEILPESEDDPIAKITMKDVVVFMKSGYSYAGPGVSFSREAPFQRMDAIEAQRLIDSMPRRFCLATREQVEEFYSLG